MSKRGEVPSDKRLKAMEGRKWIWEGYGGIQMEDPGAQSRKGGSERGE